MGAALRFRCFQCDKLLGVSASKAGSVVACPKCGVELIVPDLSDESPTTDQVDPEPKPPEPALAPPPTSTPPPSEFRADDLRIATGPPDPEAIFPAIKIEEPTSLRPEAPRFRAEAPSIIPDRLATPRQRDVVLPRTAVLAWSLFALLALVSAFGMGLLAGHFLWKVH